MVGHVAAVSGRSVRRRLAAGAAASSPSTNALALPANRSALRSFGRSPAGRGNSSPGNQRGCPPVARGVESSEPVPHRSAAAVQPCTTRRDAVLSWTGPAPALPSARGARTAARRARDRAVCFRSQPIVREGFHVTEHVRAVLRVGFGDQLLPPRSVRTSIATYSAGGAIGRRDSRLTERAASPSRQADSIECFANSACSSTAAKWG